MKMEDEIEPLVKNIGVKIFWKFEWFRLLESGLNFPNSVLESVCQKFQKNWL